MDSPEPIILDALNYLDRYFHRGASQKDPWAELLRAQQRIAAFVQAVKASGHSLTIVVDAGTESADATKKWVKRRESELRRGCRSVVLGVDAFICEAFAGHGVQAICPRGADADDVLAALAFCSNGVLLSRDSDFTRYDQPLTVASSWEQSRGRVKLLPAANLRLQPVTNPRRTIMPELAEKASQSAYPWTFSPEVKYRPSLCGGKGRRGVSSSSDVLLGSLHRLTAPLRLARFLPNTAHRSAALLVWAVSFLPAEDKYSSSPDWYALRSSSLQGSGLLAPGRGRVPGDISRVGLRYHHQPQSSVVILQKVLGRGVITRSEKTSRLSA